MGRLYVQAITALSLVLLFCGISQAVQFVDGPIARRQIEKETRELFEQENFEALERIATEYRSTKAMLPEGLWKLIYFYEAFKRPPSRTDASWKKHLDIIDKWRSMYPDSITSKVSASHAWIGYGWQARGGGDARTVSEEGWRLYRERTRVGYELVADTPKSPAEDCPERYKILLEYKKEQGASREEFDALFRSAIAFEPTYITFYLAKSDYLHTKWHGKEGEWEAFAKEACDLGPPEYGKSFYTRILWSAQLVGSFNSFKSPRLSWPLMKQGFIDIERNFPNSPWNLNNFCKYAIMAGDKETARELFMRIGDQPYMAAWNGQFNAWRKWAGVE